MPMPQKLTSCYGIDEIKNWKALLKQIIAEFLGTFLFLCISLLGSDNLGANVAGNKVRVALTNGLAIATVVQIIGQVSGGHVNPAVTVGVMVCGDIKVLRALCYVAAQILGSIAGSFVAYALTTTVSRGSFGVTEPSADLRADQVFGLEFLTTFTMILVILSAIDPNRGAKGLGSTPLAIGLSVTACQTACYLYTVSMNPVRSLGPAVVMNKWSYHWVYWVSPISAGAVAGLIFPFLLSASRRDALSF